MSGKQDKVWLTELRSQVARRSGMNEKAVDLMLDTLFEIIAQHLSQRRRVILTGFGTFFTTVLSARERIIFGHPVLVPRQIRARFRPSKRLQERVDQLSEAA